MKKITNIFFLFFFFAIIVLPLLNTNRTPDQKSEIDNKVLVDMPSLASWSAFTVGLELYLLDRIGFRTEMIYAYQEICNFLFRKLVHPIYMYGKDGYIFFKGEYIDDYQHLNVDKKYIKKCASYIEDIYKYLSERDIKFIFFLAPDKKSVYKEFFPSSINVFSGESQTDLLVNQFKLRKIPFIYPIEFFLEAKKYEQIYNKKYDAGHWNEHGAFIGHSIITQKLKEYFSDIQLLSKDDFEIVQIKMTSLPVSHFKIDEEVPYYKLKKNKKRQVAGKSILIFHDSYFGEINKYYSKNFFEIRTFHMEKIDDLKELSDRYKPDIVLIENAERTINVWYRNVR